MPWSQVLSNADSIGYYTQPLSGSKFNIQGVVARGRGQLMQVCDVSQRTTQQDLHIRPKYNKLWYLTFNLTTWRGVGLPYIGYDK